jgi:hypothetical protein
MLFRTFVLSMIAFAICGLSRTSVAQTYQPPILSKELLKKIDFAKASPVNGNYSSQFSQCDDPGPAQDMFEGHSVRLPNAPDEHQYYLCSRDKSNLKALLQLAEGGVLWQSKMALDTDGSWAAWNGMPGTTGQKETSVQWPGTVDGQAAQIDPDIYPYIVIPSAVPPKIADTIGNTTEVTRLKSEFQTVTKVRPWNMGVVVFRDRWTPVFVADTGPFNKIGEASVRVFEELGQSRCKKWNSDYSHCVGVGDKKSPYIESGLNDPDTGKETDKALFVVWPGSAKFGDLTPSNAICKVCEFAASKLGLLGADICLRSKCPLDD